jgi:LPS sulfotransferase NodH
MFNPQGPNEGFYFTDDHIRHMIETDSHDGIFGAKVMFDQVVSYIGTRSFNRMFHHSRFVFIRRQDKVEQAISLSRAMQTGSWMGTQEPTIVPEYKFWHILTCQYLIYMQERGWTRFFEEYKVPHITVWYEDLQQNPDEQLNIVTSYILSTKTSLSAVTDMKIQRDSLTEMWKEQFSKDLTEKIKI